MKKNPFNTVQLIFAEALCCLQLIVCVKTSVKTYLH